MTTPYTRQSLPHGISEDVLVPGVYDTGKRADLITYDIRCDSYSQGPHRLLIVVYGPGKLPEGVVSARVRSNGDRVIHAWEALYDQCKELQPLDLPKGTKVGW